MVIPATLDACGTLWGFIPPGSNPDIILTVLSKQPTKVVNSSILCRHVEVHRSSMHLYTFLLSSRTARSCPKQRHDR